MIRLKETFATLNCQVTLIHFQFFSILKESKVPEAWIGLHDPAKESRYVWVDGSSIPFSEWLEGEPNGNRSENCIVHTKQNYFGGWADKNCLEAKAFVCEVSVPGKYTP